jgi:hypothetical protein
MTELMIANAMDVSELLYEQGNRDASGLLCGGETGVVGSSFACGSPVEVTPSVDGGSRTLTFDTSGLNVSPLGAHFFSVSAEDLEDATDICLNHADTTDFMVINVDCSDVSELTLGSAGFPTSCNTDANFGSSGSYTEDAEVTNRHTIWNFYVDETNEDDVLDISLGNVGWRGVQQRSNLRFTLCRLAEWMRRIALLAASH